MSNLRALDPTFTDSFDSAIRTFSLAPDVDDGKVQARYADGVFSLELPKKASAASKKTAVQ